MASRIICTGLWLDAEFCSETDTSEEYVCAHQTVLCSSFLVWCLFCFCKGSICSMFDSVIDCAMDYITESLRRKPNQLPKRWRELSSNINKLISFVHLGNYYCFSVNCSRTEGDTAGAPRLNNVPVSLRCLNPLVLHYGRRMNTVLHRLLGDLVPLAMWEFPCLWELRYLCLTIGYFQGTLGLIRFSRCHCGIVDESFSRVRDATGIIRPQPLLYGWLELPVLAL